MSDIDVVMSINAAHQPRELQRIVIEHARNIIGRYLYNEELINNDPEYGAKRRSLPDNCEEFTQSRGAYADLLLTIRTNPKAIAARDYAIGYLLLANDSPHINAFADEFYGTELMPKTPQRLQEAMVYRLYRLRASQVPISVRSTSVVSVLSTRAAHW